METELPRGMDRSEGSQPVCQNGDLVGVQQLATRGHNVPEEAGSRFHIIRANLLYRENRGQCCVTAKPYIFLLGASLLLSGKPCSPFHILTPSAFWGTRALMRCRIVILYGKHHE